MNDPTRIFSWAILGAGLFISMAWGCGSREQATAAPDPVDIPLLPPPEWCALPEVLDGVETCRLQARCCDHTLSSSPETCSFARTASGAECVCALRAGNEVRCKESSGVTCDCIQAR